MWHLSKIIKRTLSVRLSLMIVSAMALLLIASMIVMLRYSRKTVKEEALQKASQTLESTVERMDNILLSIEQATGNLFMGLYNHLDKPDQVNLYCRKLVESNDIVDGCAVAFKPFYYPQSEHFMSYYHRVVNDDGDTVIIKSDMFADDLYTNQKWYIVPMETKKLGWLTPLEDSAPADYDPIITYCLPLFGPDGQIIGVIGVDVSLEELSNVIAEAKPSEHSYSVLLDRNGSFIVSPNGNVQQFQSSASLLEDDNDPETREALRAMTSGETGYRPVCFKGKDYYVFYKPFKRSQVPSRYLDDLGWSAGIIFPKDDVFGDYNKLLYYVWAIAFVSLLLLFYLCRTIIHIQLKPLRMLTEKAQLISKGNYNEPIPDSHQADEIGRLQDNFQQMQQSLAKNIGELEQLTAQLQQDGEELQVAYRQAQQADRVKTVFLHSMTDQMTAPADAIGKDVGKLYGLDAEAKKQEADQIIDNILQNGNTIAELLDGLINVSVGKIREEVNDD